MTEEQARNEAVKREANKPKSIKHVVWTAVNKDGVWSVALVPTLEHSLEQAMAAGRKAKAKGDRQAFNKAKLLYDRVKTQIAERDKQDVPQETQQAA